MGRQTYFFARASIEWIAIATDPNMPHSFTLSKRNNQIYFPLNLVVLAKRILCMRPREAHTCFNMQDFCACVSFFFYISHQLSAWTIGKRKAHFSRKVDYSEQMLLALENCPLYACSVINNPLRRHRREDVTSTKQLNTAKQNFCYKYICNIAERTLTNSKFEQFLWDLLVGICDWNANFWSVIPIFYGKNWTCAEKYKIH